MRGGSPAPETDHVWAAAAQISPLCKVASPPMINSTGEQNGGSWPPLEFTVGDFSWSAWM
jgi:hypothetical protein